MGLRLLVLKWQGVDVAVFEADTYAQGIRHALSQGSLWPWDLTGRFWPFLLMAPGIYLHLPLLLPFPGGLAPLVLQALAVGATALLLAALARREGLAPVLAAGLGLSWLVHPLAAVALAWGWSPYVSGAPLLVAGLLALRTRRRGLGVLLLLLAMAMKVNIALMVAGLAAWLWLAARRAGGRTDRTARSLALAAAAWTLVSGLAFASSAWCVGTLSEDLNVAGPAPATAGGLWTLALLLLPALPLLGRRGLGLVLASTGVELAYSLWVNPANSGLVPATALVLAAGALELPRLSRPGWRLSAAVGLGLLGQQLFAPPRVSPLPLTAAGLAYSADPRGQVLRDWVRQLPDDAWLLTFDPANGAVGPHPGRVLEPLEWDQQTEVAVLLPADRVEELGLQDCTDQLVAASPRGPAVYAGLCGRQPPVETPQLPALECLDGLGLDRP